MLYDFSGISVTLKNDQEENAMSREEREKLQKALTELSRENNSKEKATLLFMKDGYFDQNGKLAQEFRESE